MKFCIVALCVTLVSMCLLPTFAFAQENLWVRVTKDNTFVYATEQGEKVVCIAEKSYYMQILAEKENMYFVTFMPNVEDFPQISGYVYKKEVKICQDAPQNPTYPTEKVVVSGNSAQIKLSPTPSAETVITATNTQQMSYYGKLTSYGQNWYYVYFAGKFGYVLAESVTTPNVTLHPTPLDSQATVVVPAPDVDDIPDDDVTNQTSPTAEIILIVFVSLLALAITFALFLPVKSKKQVFDGDI